MVYISLLRILLLTSSELKTGTKVISVIGYGESFWTHSYRVETELSNGEQKSYFLKVLYEQNLHFLGLIHLLGCRR